MQTEEYNEQYIDFKMVGKYQGFLLLQRLDNLDLYIKISDDANHILKIYNQDLYAVPLQSFTNATILAVIANVIKQAQIPVNIRTLVHRRIFIQNSESHFFEHTIQLKSFVQLTLEDDKVSELIPLNITCSRDGSFFHLECAAFKINKNAVFQSERNKISSTYFNTISPNILIFASEPNSFLNYAADGLGAVVYFSKRVYNISHKN